MALGTDYTLTTTTPDFVFTKTKVDGATARFMETSSTLVEPLALDVKYTTVSKGSLSTDRTLHSLSQVEVNANGIPVKEVINFTLARDRDPAITDAMEDNLILAMCEWIADATRKGKFRRQEV
jgi:hypothetical protein